MCGAGEVALGGIALKPQGNASNGLWIAGGALFDRLAAMTAGHQHELTGRAVDHHGTIKRARRRDFLLDVDPADRLTGGAGLGRDERPAEELPGDGANLAGIRCELDAAARRAATGVHLGLDGEAPAAEAAGQALPLVGAGGDAALR